MLRFLLAAIQFSMVALAAPSNGPLPACNDDYLPCKCPHGTTFKNLTSQGIIGAPAIEVQKVMANFFNLDWQQGLKPASTSGDPTVPGARRGFNFTGPSGGYYQITEVLTKYSTSSDGSFVQGYEQAPNPPVVQVPGGGSYHGEWALITADQTVIANETVVAYRNWRCETGETFDAATSHEQGIANVSTILQHQGKHTGVDVTPFTIFYTVRND